MKTGAAAIAVACVVSASAAVSASSRTAACAQASALPTTPEGVAAADTATLCLVNGIRTARGLHALRASTPLTAVATAQVRSMVRLDYFLDVRPGGPTPFALVQASRYGAGAHSLSVGQNIAWGTEGLASPAKIVAAWMASPGHRAIILYPGYRDAGVGIDPAAPRSLSQGKPGATYAMEFAARS